MKTEYKTIIELMASHYDLYGEMPNQYSEEFQAAVCHKLMKDETGMQYTHYRYLPLFERDYRFPELLKMVCAYILADGDIDRESKISKELAETIVKNATDYFRDDIENDIEIAYRHKYRSLHSSSTIYASHFDYSEP